MKFPERADFFCVISESSGDRLASQLLYVLHPIIQRVFFARISARLFVKIGDRGGIEERSSEARCVRMAEALAHRELMAARKAGNIKATKAA